MRIENAKAVHGSINL